VDLPPTPPQPNLPPADWYPDPENPGKLRYWDGAVWTEHRHTEGATTPDIDHFFKRTFAVLGARWKPLAMIIAVLGLPTALIGTLGLAWLVQDWVITFNDAADTAGDVADFEGFEVANLVLAGVMLLALIVLSFWQAAALAHQLHDGHQQLEPGAGASWATSLRIGLRRMWPLIGLSFAIGLGIFIAVMIAVAAGVAFPPLLIIVVPAVLVLAVWVWVKTVFIPISVVAPKTGEGSLQASANVSRTRFGAIFGRVLLLAILSAVLNLVGNIFGSAFGGQQNFDNSQFGTDDPLVVADFFPSVAASIPLSLVTWLFNGIAIAVYFSGLAMLFVAAQSRGTTS